MEEPIQDQGQRIGGDEDNEIVTEGTSFVHGEPPQDGDSPPKVDSEVEILHEKVTKQIIKEGHGQKPSKYATCFVHYRAWTESTQHKFEDTWHEQKPVEIVLGKEKKEMEGLAVGISSMKTNERALLHVGWELGYGKEGSFSFPNVPPMADVLYEVELIGFDETKEVLTEDGNNVKALFRRGKARAELGQTDVAREDFLKAKKFAPEDKAIARELRLLAEHDKALYKKQKEIYKGLFGPRPEPKPQRANWLIFIWHWILSLFTSLFKSRRQKDE